MKKIFKVLIIIALVTVIGFSMVACEEEETGDAYLTVVNQFDRPVTKVYVGVKLSFTDLNITKGNSQTFTIPDTEFDTSVDVNSRSSTIEVTCSGDDQYTHRRRFVAFQSGKTVTITVNASGNLE
jgi:hypothetical protein